MAQAWPRAGSGGLKSPPSRQIEPTVHGSVALGPWAQPVASARKEKCGFCKNDCEKIMNLEVPPMKEFQGAKGRARRKARRTREM